MRRNLSGLRARRAEEVLNTNAGVALPSDAPVNAEGNAHGRKYDLAQDGAYDGMKVFAFAQFQIQRCGYNWGHPNEALKRKGFDTEWWDGPDLGMSDADFAAKLKEASQFWFISDRSMYMTEKQISIIVDAWKEGMGLYIFGDNEPLYHDANRILKAIGLPAMKGNYEARKTVTQPADADPLLWTGIVNLPEGATIAEWSDAEVENASCKGVMRNSRGIWSVIMKPSENGCGPVIADGAFTKLFCDWTDAGGSARFVCNCACWLSTLVGDDQDAVSRAKEAATTLAKRARGSDVDSADTFSAPVVEATKKTAPKRTASKKSAPKKAKAPAKKKADTKTAAKTAKNAAKEAAKKLAAAKKAIAKNAAKKAAEKKVAAKELAAANKTAAKNVKYAEKAAARLVASAKKAAAKLIKAAEKKAAKYNVATVKTKATLTIKKAPKTAKKVPAKKAGAKKAPKKATKFPARKAGAKKTPTRKPTATKVTKTAVLKKTGKR